MFSRFSSNSEASASELSKNIENMCVYLQSVYFTVTSPVYAYTSNLNQ